MASSSRKSSRFSKKRTQQSTTIPDKFSHIVFESREQEERFLTLSRNPLTPTRFLCRRTLKKLNIEDDVCALLANTGCGGLIGMCEPTYECLTLEFLSSFEYNRRGGLVYFRLMNQNTRLTLAQFGNLLGARGNGFINAPRDTEALTWRMLTGGSADVPGWKFRMHMIHHPVIRIWARTIGMTYFARPEITNMKTCEVDILFSWLNLDHGEQFEMNVAHHIAHHFEEVASGRITEILMGGLVTHIVKARGNFDATNMVCAGGPLYLDLPYLYSGVRYIKPVDTNVSERRRQWWWRLENEVLCKLPSRDENGRLTCPYPEVLRDPYDTQPILYEYFLMPIYDENVDQGPQHATAGQSSQQGAYEMPPLGGQYMPAPGSYGDFTYQPWQHPPYDPSYYDPTEHPSTFAAPAPFNRPDVWNDDTRDSTQWALCNKLEQMHMQESVYQHNIYSWHHSQGHFPPGTIHPPCFVPPQQQQPQPPQYDSPPLGIEYTTGAAGDSDYETSPNISD